MMFAPWFEFSVFGRSFFHKRNRLSLSYVLTTVAFCLSSYRLALLELPTSVHSPVSCLVGALSASEHGVRGFDSRQRRLGAS